MFGQNCMFILSFTSGSSCKTSFFLLATLPFLCYFLGHQLYHTNDLCFSLHELPTPPQEPASTPLISPVSSLSTALLQPYCPLTICQQVRVKLTIRLHQDLEFQGRFSSAPCRPQLFSSWIIAYRIQSACLHGSTVDTIIYSLAQIIFCGLSYFYY